MESVTITQILERLQELPAEKLVVVYDFVSYLSEKQPGIKQILEGSEAYHTMLASEAILRQDWDRPEEDAAWADL